MARQIEAIVEYVNRKDDEGFWLDVYCDGAWYASIGPHNSEVERDSAATDLLHMMRTLGATDIPNYKQ